MFKRLIERKVSPYILSQITYAIMWFMLYVVLAVVLFFLVPIDILPFLSSSLNWPFICFCGWIATCIGGILWDSMMIRYLYDKKYNKILVIKNPEIYSLIDDDSFLNGEILLHLCYPMTVQRVAFVYLEKYKEKQNGYMTKYKKRYIRFVCDLGKASLLENWECFDRQFEKYPYDYEIYEHSKVLRRILLRDGCDYPEEIREIVKVLNEMYP